jgi:hypothetical protein
LKEYSPYINHFIQPDTIIPNPADPQSLNRFSYVQNNPIRYFDPSGHKRVEDMDGGGPCNIIDCTSGGTPDGGLDDIPSDSKSASNETDNPFVEIWNYYTSDDIIQIMSGSNGCWNSFSSFWYSVECLDINANLTQDISTLFSTTGASTTLTIIALACIPTSGVGCAAGYVYGFGIYQTFLNPYESTFSIVSFALTVRSDILTNDTYINSLTDWQIGEDSKTGFGTALIGALMPEPFIDAGIDIYSSGYNHGYFCGVSTILDCLP